MLFDTTSELEAAQRENDDLGYPLGWLCGASLVAGVIVGGLAVGNGRTRRAFQAFVQPVATILALVLMFLLMAALEAATGPWRGSIAEENALFFLALGVLLAPLPIQYALQKIRWPRASANDQGSSGRSTT